MKAKLKALLGEEKSQKPSYLKNDYEYSGDKSYSSYSQDGEGKVQGSGMWAGVRTSISFIINDIRKRDREFKIGLISVFLVVAFTTVLSAFLNSTPSLFFMVAQANSGDFDVILTALPDD